MLSAAQEWWETNWKLVIWIWVGVILAGIGVFVWRTREIPDTVEVLEAVEPSTIPLVLAVDVSGAVEKPGLYRLPVDSRVEDALTLAGGITADAEKTWVEKYLNRSAKLTDGQKIYVPRKEEVPVSQAQVHGAVQSGQSEKTNINTASSTLLEDLPGIGKVTAGKIVNGRPYTKIEELKERKIVTAKVFDQIKEMISVW